MIQNPGHRRHPWRVKMSDHSRSGRTSSGIPEVDPSFRSGDGPQLEEVFGRFVKSEDPPGSGLGLSIARGLARAHGGDVEIIASRPDGTSASLWLPRRRDNRPAHVNHPQEGGCCAVSGPKCHHPSQSSGPHQVVRDSPHPATFETEELRARHQEHPPPLEGADGVRFSRTCQNGYGGGSVAVEPL